jgi:hypothetical protein
VVLRCAANKALNPNYPSALVALKGHGFHRLLKKSEKQIPLGLKPARDDKNKELNGAPKGAPLQSIRLDE